MLADAMRLGWTPETFWQATLAEFELAIAVRMQDIDATTRQSAMTEDDMRTFYDRMRGSEG